MPVDLTDLIGDGRPAVLTMELQRGVVGDLSSFPELAAVAQSGGVLENAARLVRAARSSGVPVIHCTAGFRADRRGSPSNAPLMTAMLRRPHHLVDGDPAVDLIPEVGLDAGDLVSHRSHGVSPFHATSLDPILRSLGVSTVIAAGVSVNLGIVGLAIEAVNFGYRVVVPTDAVAGLPRDYAESVVRNTLALVAKLATVDEVVDAFG